MKKESINKIELTDKQLSLIERIGDMNSKDGMQPSSARIIALLMVCDKIELTFDEIRETLELSKSATSNAINMLLQIKHIDYVTKIGDRKRYFKSNIDLWKNQFNALFERLTRFSSMLEEIHDARTPETVEFNNSLLEVHDFIQYFLSEVPAIYSKWEKLKQ